jgi:hypothetical protein
MKNSIIIFFVFSLFFSATAQRNEADIYIQARQNIEKCRKTNFKNLKPDDQGKVDSRDSKGITKFLSVITMK